MCRLSFVVGEKFDVQPPTLTSGKTISLLASTPIRVLILLARQQKHQSHNHMSFCLVDDREVKRFHCTESATWRKATAGEDNILFWSGVLLVQTLNTKKHY